MPFVVYRMQNLTAGSMAFLSCEATLTAACTLSLGANANISCESTLSATATVESPITPTVIVRNDYSLGMGGGIVGASCVPCEPEEQDKLKRIIEIKLIFNNHTYCEIRTVRDDITVSISKVNAAGAKPVKVLIKKVSVCTAPSTIPVVEMKRSELIAIEEVPEINVGRINRTKHPVLVALEEI